MKRISMILAFVMAFITQVMAQTNMIDVVYLTNGSMIRGIIIEQVPNESLKIKTAEGSIFVYQMNEVEKIAKEEASSEDTKSLYDQHIRKEIEIRKANALKKGYLGYIDWQYVYPFGDFKKSFYSTLSTVHGYQFNPYLFAGAGVGISFYTIPGELSLGIPVFADIRVTPLKNYITPLAEIKLGHSFADIKGLYFSVAAGIYGAQAKGGINVLIGYQLQQMDGIVDTKIENGEVYVKEGTISLNGFFTTIAYIF